MIFNIIPLSFSKKKKKKIRYQLNCVDSLHSIFFDTYHNLYCTKNALPIHPILMSEMV